MNALDMGTLYVVSRVKEALAADERTHVLDIVVEVQDRHVFLSGNVSCDRRRLVAEEVAREVVPEPMTLVNALCVERYDEPLGPEPLD
jgi:hypothetical protein